MRQVNRLNVPVPTSSPGETGPCPHSGLDAPPRDWRDREPAGVLHRESPRPAMRVLSITVLVVLAWWVGASGLLTMDDVSQAIHAAQGKTEEEQ